MKHKNILKISSAGFWLYSPVSILAYPVSVLVVNPGSSPTVLTLTGLVITIGAYAFYAMMEILSKNLKQYTATLFLVTVIATGSIRGVLFYWANDFLNMTQPTPLNERVIASMITTMLWLSAANVVINISRNFKREYQGTLNQYLASQVAQATLSIQNNQELLEINKFQSDLSTSLSDLMQATDTSTFEKISERITFHINEQLRPLSRRIWVRSLSEYPVINYRSLIKDSISLLNFPYWLFLAIMSALAILNNLFLRGINESLWRTITYILPSFLGLQIFSKLRGKFVGLKINWIFLIAISFIPIYISEFVVLALGYETNFLATALITPIPMTVIIVLSLLDLTNRDREFLLRLLEQSGDSIYTQTSSGVNLNQRQIASYLHNSFQSELLALSGQLAAAAMSNDKVETSAVLQRVNAVANRSLAEDLTKINEKPLRRLKSVIESWGNLLDIEISIAEDVLQTRLNSVVFVQTVEEIASNAFRHDKASKLKITAEAGVIGTKLIFQSNGTQPITKSKGMGKLWLNQISLSPWTIEKNSEGTLITLEL